MAGKNTNKRTDQVTIPREERLARGQTELRARLNAERTEQLAAVLASTGESAGEWVWRKLAEDFARLNKTANSKAESERNRIRRVYFDR